MSEILNEDLIGDVHVSVGQDTIEPIRTDALTFVETVSAIRIL